MSGVDLVVIKEILGHSSMAMVLRYAHLSKNHVANAIRKLTFEHSHKSVTCDSWDNPLDHSSDCYTEDCRSGGIGRRKGLKIPRSLLCAGSIPASGINNDPVNTIATTPDR